MNSAADTVGDEPEAAQIRRWRGPLTVFLTIVATLSVILAVTSTWVRSTLLDTDQWVEAVAPLPQQPALQDLIAVRVADDVVELLDLSSVLADRIGPRASFLAAPIESAIAGLVEDATLRVVSSERFESLWIQANRLAHQGAVALIRGEGHASIVDGAVVLDVVPIIHDVIASLSERTPEFFGGRITVPAADQIAGASQRLADALGVDIPPDFGKVTVLESDVLDPAQRAVRVLDDGVIALWVLFALSLVGALAASADRRRTVAVIGSSAALGALVLWLIREPLEASILDSIANPNGQVAAGVVIDVVLWRGYDRLLVILVVIAVAAALVAFLAGPSGTATAIRRTLAGVSRGDRPQTAVSEFIRRHVAGFRIAGAVAAILAAVSLPKLTWGWLLAIGVVLAAYEAALSLVQPSETRRSG